MWSLSYGNNEDTQPPAIPLSKKASTLNTMFSSPTPTPTPTPAYCGYLLNRDFLAAVNHQHSSNTSEKNKREDSLNIEEMSMGATRWTPTPEQLYALEEIYQSGTRTPSATHIQQIAAGLRRFGKIEGKNVFYWFQNHKARERQKRRRRQHLHNSLSPNKHLQIKGQSLGLIRTCFEVGQAKNWFTPSDCSTISEESIVSSLATAEVAKSEMDEKIEIEDRGLQLKLGIGEQNINEFSRTCHALDHKAQNHNNLWMPPFRDTMIKTTEERRNNQTLELFPYWIGGDDVDEHKMTDGGKADDPFETGTATLCSKFTPPTHFFEFLPLKKT